MACSICLNKLNRNIKTLECGHSFHYNCIKNVENMLSIQFMKFCCPLCRYQYENDIKYNTRSNSLDYVNDILVEITKLLYQNINSKNFNLRCINIIKMLDLFISHPRMVLSFGEQFKNLAYKKIEYLKEDIYNKEINKGISNDLLTQIEMKINLFNRIYIK